MLIFNILPGAYFCVPVNIPKLCSGVKVICVETV